jgi:ABC-type nitrate/sulfonate/bicarbonate transport system permease component
MLWDFFASIGTHGLTFVVALLVGVCIGFTIGAAPPKQ